VIIEVQLDATYVQELWTQHRKQPEHVNPEAVTGTVRLKYADNSAYLLPQQPLLSNYLPAVNALLRTVAPHSPFWRKSDDTAARLQVTLSSCTRAHGCMHKSLAIINPVHY
jgi:hypothetical protein